MNRFLSGLTPGERRAISALTEAVTDHLHTWAAPFGIFDPSRFATTALTMAAAAPWLPLADLCEMAAIPLWIFTVDDCLDQGRFNAAERRGRARHYAEIAAARPGAEPRPEDPYAEALLAIQRRLVFRPLYRVLAGEWAHTCRTMLAGMIFECRTGERVRSGRSWPALRTYLDHGLNSIGVPLYLAGAWMIVGGPETPGLLPTLRPMARDAGRAVRLANDRRTLARERAEGNANVLMLLQAKGWEPERAQEWVSARAAASARRVARRAARSEDAAAVRVTRRVCQFSVDFYDEHDFHTVERRDIHLV